MKKNVFILAIAIMTGVFTVRAQELPDRQKTLDVILSVNNYFMYKYADPTTTSNVGRVRPSNIWTRGVYYEGLMALYGIYPKDEFLDYTKKWADFHDWGMRHGNTTRNADDHCCGQAYIDMYRITGDRKMIQNIEASMEMLLNTPQVDDWWWIDAIQMAMPIFVKLAKERNYDQRYYDKMWDMYEYTRNTHGENGMYNAKEGLWWRDHDFDPPYKEPNGRNCYWSRGNGWVYAALVRVLDELPQDE